MSKKRPDTHTTNDPSQVAELRAQHPDDIVLLTSDDPAAGALRFWPGREGPMRLPPRRKSRYADGKDRPY